MIKFYKVSIFLVFFTFDLFSSPCSVRIESDPGLADIFISKRFRGISPVNVMLISGETYDIVLKFMGEGVFKTKLNLKCDGGVANVKFNLIRKVLKNSKVDKVEKVTSVDATLKKSAPSFSILLLLLFFLL